MRSEANTVDEYLDEVPENRLEALERLRKLCLEVLDGYEESMDYGMPSYRNENGDIEVAFASQRSYISFYVLKEAVLDKYREALAGLNLGKGCVRYRRPDQIDFELARQLLAESYHSDAEIC